MPYYEDVTEDIVIIPQFTQEDRYYTISFYGVDSTTPFETKSCKYGSTWQQIQPSSIPYKEPPAGLYEVWDFKGYALIAGSSSAVPSNYTVTNNQSFYAIFELASDVRNIVHEEWFDFADYTYEYDNTYPDYAPTPLVGKVIGYSIKPKFALRGKVTIPSFYNGKPVISLKNDFGTDSDLTHVFCAADSQLLVIEDSAFAYTDLQYFDFSQNTVRAVQSKAFLRCKLEAAQLQLSENLFYVGSEAFQAGIYSSTPVTIHIPGSVALVHVRGFNNPTIAKGSTLEVGTETNFSRLDLSWPGFSTDYINKFTADDGKFANVIFRTIRYHAWDEVINNNPGGFQVYQAFVRTNQNINLTMSTWGG